MPTSPPTRVDDEVYGAAQVAGRLMDRSVAHVFSHPSKVELITRAAAAGYLVYLHVILVPLELL